MFTIGNMKERMDGDRDEETILSKKETNWNNRKISEES